MVCVPIKLHSQKWDGLDLACRPWFADLWLKPVIREGFVAVSPLAYTLMLFRILLKGRQEIELKLILFGTWKNFVMPLLTTSEALS